MKSRNFFLVEITGIDFKVNEKSLLVRLVQTSGEKMSSVLNSLEKRGR